MYDTDSTNDTQLVPIALKLLQAGEVRLVCWEQVATIVDGAGQRRYRSHLPRLAA